MSPDGAHRLETLLALAPESELQRLALTLDCRDTISAVRDALLGDSGDCTEVIAELDSETFDLLLQVSATLPPSLPLRDPPPQLAELMKVGLAFEIEIQGEQRIYVPLEAQLHLHRRRALTDPDLRLLLLSLSEEDLGRLEAIYDADEAADDSVEGELGHVCRLADAMESPATLREVYQSLTETAQEVLGWTCEHSGPLAVDEVQELARDAAQFREELAGVAVGQLLRFGLLVAHELELSGEVYVVPRSLRPSLLSVVDQKLAMHARSHYENLVATGHLSFPDEGPHGWGGDALRAFRLLTVAWASGQLEHLPAEYSVAVGMQMVDSAAHRPGAFASLLLDLSGETALSRQALRLWLALVDDPWTVDLIEITGGDASKLVTHFSGQEPESAEDSDVWFSHIFLLRAQLLLILSLLPPGKWFPLEGLAHLYHALVARSTIANLSHEVISARFPYEALPDYGVVIARADRYERFRRWLEAWLVEFVSVIGAAELDRTGTFFRVHPDAFCVFRDSDLWFRTVWEDLTPVVGDDLDIWMPIPNDPGPRVSGVANAESDGKQGIRLDRECHLFDLIRLARWAETVPATAGYAFELNAKTVAKALEDGKDGDEMLLWLAVRLYGEISPGLRALFPQSSSAVDGPIEGWRGAAHRRVEELLLSLESWSGSPPGRLLEEIRSWGTAAIPPVRTRLETLAKADRLTDPMVQHLCVLLGELGADSAGPILLEVLTRAQTEVVQHAAAAACMRVGRASLPELTRLTRSQETPKETRLIAAMGLTGVATLHPDTYDEVAETLVDTINNSAFDSDFQTRMTLELCRLGHPKAEAIVEQLQSEDSWINEDWRPEDALWLIRVSPCVWGSLLFSTPMAMLYLVSDEADELAREAGVRDILKKAGLTSESILYGQSRPRRD